MTESRITTWQQPDDLWAFRLEAACERCYGMRYVVSEEGSYQAGGQLSIACPDCKATGTVAYSQHGFRTRKLALVRAKQVIRERSLEPRRHEETIEVEGT